jgi:signal-transduction protein with cAMP-binding, CBS, and nucleotidyltransferase domain
MAAQRWMIAVWPGSAGIEATEGRVAVKVSECSRKAPVTVARRCSLAEAAQLMEHHDVGALLVVANGRLVGIATDRDLVVRGLAKRLDPDTPISEVMTTDVTTVQGSEDVTEALKILREVRFRRLPVLDGDTVSGIITVDDLLVTLVVELAAVAAPIAAAVVERPV